MNFMAILVKSKIYYTRAPPARTIHKTLLQFLYSLALAYASELPSSYGVKDLHCNWLQQNKT